MDVFREVCGERDALLEGITSLTKRLAVEKGVDSARTRAAVDQAVDEVRRAVRPERRNPARMLSWLVALTAGAAVTWKSLRAANGATAAPLTNDLGDAPDSRRVKASDTQARRKVAGAGKRSRELSRSDAKGRSASAGTDECPTIATGPVPLIKELWCRFQSIECMTRAQALAFVGVLSLGPVLLFALAALGFVIHGPAQVEYFVHHLVGQLLPGRQASEAANNLIAQTHILESAQTLMKGKWWAVSIALLSLLWAAVGLFVGASDPMNAAWSVRESRSFVKLRLVCLAVFVGAGVLFLLSLIPSSLPSLVGRIRLPLIGSLPPGAWWLELAAWVLAVIVDTAMFSVIYRFLPNARVLWKPSIAGGAVAGVLWELFKKGFAVYLAHFGNYDKLYGALGGAVLLVTWIWYSCVLLLLGAIVSRMYNEHAEDGGVVQTSADSHRAM